jgi:hypothetical protein
LFVPLWGLVTWFIYGPRRVQCPEHGVVVEHVPWSEGKAIDKVGADAANLRPPGEGLGFEWM